jgi:moderate conductance mechanosensitive channel
LGLYAIDSHGGPPILTLLPFLVVFDDQFRDDAIRSAVRIVLILSVAIVAIWVLQRVINPLIRVAVREQMKAEPEEEILQRIETLSHVVYRTLLLVVLVMTGIILLTEAGINVAPLVAGLGLVGLAVGFGAQSLVKDMINGLFILMDNQYSKGDVVTIASTTGIVEEINLRRTVLRDIDGTVHFIPHSTIDVSSNWTKEYSRIHLNVGVAYESDLDHVIEVINRVGKAFAEEPAFAPKILSAPQVLRVDNFGDSSIDIKVVGETMPLEQWSLMGQFRIRLKKAFDEEGIVIPYPQRTLHLDTAAALMELDGKRGLMSGSASKAMPEPPSEARVLDDSPDAPGASE